MHRLLDMDPVKKEFKFRILMLFFLFLSRKKKVQHVVSFINLHMKATL
jgi:hypothetical protein